MPAKRTLAGREVLIEIVTIGAHAKVGAIDSATGTEISITGPAEAERSTLRPRHCASSSSAEQEGRLTGHPLRRRLDDEAVRPKPIFLANSERCAA